MPMSERSSGAFAIHEGTPVNLQDCAGDASGNADLH